MTVRFLQGVADDSGLLPSVAALKFGAGLSCTPRLTESLTGSPSAPGAITGYIEIEVDAALAVTFAAVKAALATADSSVDFNGETIAVGGMTSSGPLYLGGATSGAGTIRAGSAWSLYGAVTADPLVAAAPLLVWDGAQITLGYDTDVEVLTFRAATSMAFSIAGGSSGLEVTNSDTYLAAGAGLTLDAPLITVGGTHNITFDATSGISVAPGAGALLGLYNATPIVQQGRVGQLTDSTGGSTVSNGGALVDVGAIPDQTKIDDNFAKLAAKLNALEARISQAAGGFGITA